MCLAQGHNAVTPVRLEPAASRSRVKYSTTEPLRSNIIIGKKSVGYNSYEINYKSEEKNQWAGINIISLSCWVCDIHVLHSFPIFSN